MLRADSEYTLTSALKDANIGKKEFFGILFGAWTEAEQPILFSSSAAVVSLYQSVK